MWDPKTQGQKIFNKRRKNQDTLRVLHDLVETQKYPYAYKRSLI